MRERRCWDGGKDGGGVGPILLVAGARPNFMKLAPLWHEFRRRGAHQDVRWVHTGQHYDADMSEVFIRDLALPQPDFHLGVGSGTHAAQTGAMMARFEELCLEVRPSLVVVVGDVNSTLACALVTAKVEWLGGDRCPAWPALAHVEAGLRSHDRRMPEEVNRIVTDHIADLLFATEEDAVANLIREGIPGERIYLVGNTMVDSLVQVLPRARALGLPLGMGLSPQGYGLITLHRPENVDRPEQLRLLCEGLNRVSAIRPLVFPAHPRTRRRLQEVGITFAAGVRTTEPLAYVEFIGLMDGAAFIVTDSGGLQEEATALRVPCFTVRSSTERPVTVSEGSNTIVGADIERLLRGVEAVVAGRARRGEVPHLWDGAAARRIVDVLLEVFPNGPLRGREAAGVSPLPGPHDPETVAPRLVAGES